MLWEREQHVQGLEAKALCSGSWGWFCGAGVWGAGTEVSMWAGNGSNVTARLFSNEQVYVSSERVDKSWFLGSLVP